jgi:hypothetical protein
MKSGKDKINVALQDYSRRQFLKTGMTGAIFLGLASGGMVLSGCSYEESYVCPDCEWLTPSDQSLLLAIIPVMLEGALPGSAKGRRQAVEEIIAGFDTTVLHFSPVVRKEIRQLLDLLQFPFTRIVLTGVMRPWHQEENPGIRDFLTRWQTSRFSLFRSGYYALHDLIIGAWYANPDSWKRISYPGPPRLS